MPATLTDQFLPAAASHLKLVTKTRDPEVAPVDWRLELVVVPVDDLDRAKAFYIDPDGNGWLVQEVSSPAPDHH